MMSCPVCGQAVHTRSRIHVSHKTKARDNQCTNIGCGDTFATHETFVRSLYRPEKISTAPPHLRGLQPSLIY